MNYAKIIALCEMALRYPEDAKDYDAIIRKATGQRGELTIDEEHIGQTEGKIQAIKAYRQRTGDGLRDAKEAVELHFSQFGLSFKLTNLQQSYQSSAKFGCS